jgi:hypothetical protein
MRKAGIWPDRETDRVIPHCSTQDITRDGCAVCLLSRRWETDTNHITGRDTHGLHVGSRETTHATSAAYPQGGPWM